MSAVVLAVVNATVWLLPTPTDKLGWGLRVRLLALHQPYLAKEDVHRYGVVVALINQSKEERQYLYLEVANTTGDLEVAIVQPDGKPLRSHAPRRRPIFFNERPNLPAGQFVSSVFKFQDFGYDQLPEPGEYELRASLKTAEGVVVAPAVKLTVIEPSLDAILASQAVPLEGFEALKPKDEQERAVIQQVKIGNRTWLIYRRFLSTKLGGKVSWTFRLAELPGKVEMTVEGAYGDWKPLTIKYKDPSSQTGTTTLKINSIDGRPWTDEEQRLLEKRLKPVKP